MTKRSQYLSIIIIISSLIFFYFCRHNLHCGFTNLMYGL